MKQHLIKFLWIIIGLLIIAILLLSIRYEIGPFRKSDSYYAVSLVSGDLYFGKLSQWPSLTLTDVWLFSGILMLLLLRL